jgi:D-aminoacyl-tRNA deacylase
MKVLIQRVSCARVVVDDETVGTIGDGVVALVGVEKGDDDDLARWYARRLSTMKLFAEGNVLWGRSLADVGGQVLAVSQFTLAARTRKGRRPSFDPAAEPAVAEAIFRAFVNELNACGIETSEGRFGARMSVELTNEGPVTFLLDGPARDARPGG